MLFVATGMIWEVEEAEKRWYWSRKPSITLTTMYVRGWSSRYRSASEWNGKGWTKGRLQ